MVVGQLTPSLMTRDGGDTQSLPAVINFLHSQVAGKLKHLAITLMIAYVFVLTDVLVLLEEC